MSIASTIVSPLFQVVTHTNRHASRRAHTHTKTTDTQSTLDHWLSLISHVLALSILRSLCSVACYGLTYCNKMKCVKNYIISHLKTLSLDERACLVHLWESFLCSSSMTSTCLPGRCMVLNLQSNSFGSLWTFGAGTTAKLLVSKCGHHVP